MRAALQRPAGYRDFRAGVEAKAAYHNRRPNDDLHCSFPLLTPLLGAAEGIGPISIEHREQQCLGAWISLPRRLCEVLVPNVVHLSLYTPTISVSPNQLAVRGWQAIPALV